MILLQRQRALLLTHPRRSTVDIAQLNSLKREPSIVNKRLEMEKRSRSMRLHLVTILGRKKKLFYLNRCVQQLLFQIISFSSKIVDSGSLLYISKIHFCRCRLPTFLALLTDLISLVSSQKIIDLLRFCSRSKLITKTQSLCLLSEHFSVVCIQLSERNSPQQNSNSFDRISSL